MNLENDTNMLKAREDEEKSVNAFRKSLSSELAKNYLTGGPMVPPELVKAERKAAKKARKAEKKAMKAAAKRSRRGTSGAVQKSADVGAEVERLRRENEILREAMSV